MVSELPDYLKKPTFITRQQRQAGEMEQRVEELAAVLKLINLAYPYRLTSGNYIKFSYKLVAKE